MIPAAGENSIRAAMVWVATLTLMVLLERIVPGALLSRLAGIAIIAWGVLLWGQAPLGPGSS